MKAGRRGRRRRGRGSEEIGKSGGKEGRLEEGEDRLGKEREQRGDIGEGERERGGGMSPGMGMPRNVKDGRVW